MRRCPQKKARRRRAPPRPSTYGTAEMVTMEIDLHRYHPDDLDQIDVITKESLLTKIVRQSWEKGELSLRLIHGHARNRNISPGFVNTDTGYFGLRIRSSLRNDKALRQWIKYTTLDCSHEGSTSVKLKSNKCPSRAKLDPLPGPRPRHFRRR
jgi:hypothetical protein